MQQLKVCMDPARSPGPKTHLFILGHDRTLCDKANETFKVLKANQSIVACSDCRKEKDELINSKLIPR